MAVWGRLFRHLAAADVLMMLAHTDTFVQPEAYEPVTSQPIEVRAR